MTVYASISKRTAWLGTEFGEQFARRQFGDTVVDALPRTTKGKNAGKHKASIEWLKVEKGGWVSEGDERGHVENRVGKVIASRLILTKWGTTDIEVLHLSGEAGRFN